MCCSTSDREAPRNTEGQTPEAGSALPRQESACLRQAWSPGGEWDPRSVSRAQIATGM